MQYNNEKVLATEHAWNAGKELERKIHDRSARVGVIGLGYVGLPLALEMAKADFEVTGIDIDRVKVESVNAGISYILDVPSEILLSFVAKEKIRATQSLATVETLDAISICVPTPLRKTKDPDLSYVIAAVEAPPTPAQPGNWCYQSWRKQAYNWGKTFSWLILPNGLILETEPTPPAISPK
jgi:UDP-glucose/GDP-mannose dehydrogenase family protein